MNLNCQDSAYYAGILHDVGKINPIYQIGFSIIFYSFNMVKETFEI